ncbi:hypothetical protein BHC49_01685 [Snodgrassella alvi]|uniref:Uncharacterized protein n=2 Tax=Snodgrassella alvi TaxID=1196083 RepID=A0A2N9Y0S5_9NEIS|nr:hypothetical protein BHC49_01685 [Snodgrassella alvi]
MGHNPLTITAANAVLMLRCKGVYDNFITMQGFQADNAWNFGDANLSEARIGVDGKQSMGYTPHQIEWILHLEANSKSIAILENIRKDFNTNMETRPIDIVVEIPSIKTRYSATGALISQSGGTSGQKLLVGSQYKFNLVLNGGEDIN